MSVLFNRRAVIALCAVCLGCVLVAILSYQHFPWTGGAGRDDRTRTAQQDWLEFEDANFRFARPGSDWTQVDAKRVDSNSTLAFVSHHPEMAFVVIAEAAGVERKCDLQTARELALANHRQLWDKVELVSTDRETLAGITGERMVVQVAKQRAQFTYVVWLGVWHGYVYQLQVFAQRSDVETLAEGADEMFSRFALIDAKRVAHSGKKIQDFHSPRHGYTLRLAGTQWQPWENLQEVLPDAEYGAMIGNYARSAVIPISLLGRTPRLEAITTALVARLGIAYSASQARKPQSVLGGLGQRFQMTRDVAGRTYTYRFQVNQHAGHGYLIAAWADVEAPRGTSKLLDDILDRFALDAEEPAVLASAGELTAGEKQTHAQVFNDLGLYYFSARFYTESIDYLRQAFEILENDPVLLDNVVNAHIELNQFGEARDYLRKHLPRFPEQQDLRARYAFVQARSGEVNDAIKTYAEVFDGGLRNDEALQDYVELLSEHSRQDEALAQITQYLGRGTSPRAVRLEAMLLSQKGDHGRAISVLKELQQDRPFDVELAYQLADAYLAAQQFQDGLAVCRELLDRHYDSAYTYLLKGQLELRLKWYAAAKTSFEAALHNEPSNPTAQNLLAQASGMLGEGNNSAIKQPIEPVEIPAALCAIPPREAADVYKDQYGACYLQRIEAIAFHEKESKSTTRQLIRLFDASGVTRFSTFQVELDPLGEQVYVNLLRVTDIAGKEVAFGKPSDYYLIDDTAGDIASGRKLLNIPVPGLQPGCTIELVVTRRDLGAPEHFPFTEHYFTSDVPILEDTVFVGADADDLLVRSSAGLTSTVVEGGQVWTVRSTPVFHPEPMQAPLELFVPHLLVASPGQTWQELAREYLESISDRLAIEPSTRTLAEQTTAAVSGEDEKVASLVRLVRDQFSYRAIEFGRRARVPNKGSTIVANRYGDCKDHSLLLTQLLQASGIDAQLALVCVDGTADESVPSLDQFDHMIVYAPKFHAGRFFDCTDKEASTSQVVPRGLAARRVFILDAENARFVTVPEYDQNSNLVESHRTLRLLDEGDVTIEETLRLEGYIAATLRGLLKEIQPANRASTLQKQLAMAAGGSLQIQKVDIGNLEDSSAPLVLRTDCLVKGRFHTVGESLVGQIPALWERFFLNAQRVENRLTPFVASYPLRVKSTISLSLPAGFTTGDMSSLNREEQSSFATWKVAAEAKGDTLQVDFEARRSVGQFTPDQYGAYCDSIERTVAGLAQNVVLKRTPK